MACFLETTVTNMIMHVGMMAKISFTSKQFVVDATAIERMLLMARQPKDGGITWTNETWNPIRGCSRVSEGCRNCYAERTAARFSGPGQPYEGLAKFHDLAADLGVASHWTGDVRFIPELLDQPMRWRKPRTIFVNSMSDLFHEKVTDEWIYKIFAVMRRCPQHTFQILTKRPERMRDYMVSSHTGMHGSGVHLVTAAQGQIGKCCANVWLGVSVEDQKTADERIPVLLSTPAAVRWVSYEPALGPINFQCIKETCPDHDNYFDSVSGIRLIRPQIDWIVAGGESGPGARPAHPDWFRTVRDQCSHAGVPFFFKQWGEWLHLSQVPAVLTEREREVMTFRALSVPNAHGVEYLRIGKKRAGGLLDGVSHREFPR